VIGLQVLQRERAVPVAVAQRFRDVPVANVSDAMARMSAGGARLRPLHGGGYMAGPALTVKVRPGDNDGAVRDAAAIRAGSLPVFAAGVTHRGPYKDGPGEVNVPIAVDGMVVHPDASLKRIGCMGGQ
jgi:regulator of RNase E activity RraA